MGGDESRGSSSPHLPPSLLWREAEGFHLHYRQGPASLTSSETHSDGCGDGAGRRCELDDHKSHSVLEVETSS